MNKEHFSVFTSVPFQSRIKINLDSFESFGKAHKEYLNKEHHSKISDVPRKLGLLVLHFLINPNASISKLQILRFVLGCANGVWMTYISVIILFSSLYSDFILI